MAAPPCSASTAGSRPCGSHQLPFWMLRPFRQKSRPAGTPAARRPGRPASWASRAEAQQRTARATPRRPARLPRGPRSPRRACRLIRSITAVPPAPARIPASSQTRRASARPIPPLRPPRHRCRRAGRPDPRASGRGDQPSAVAGHPCVGAFGAATETEASLAVPVGHTQISFICAAATAYPPPRPSMHNGGSRASETSSCVTFSRTGLSGLRVRTPAMRGR
jgi:hypothetical protein